MENFLLVASDVHSDDEVFEILTQKAQQDGCLAFLYAGDLETDNYFISDALRKRSFVFVPALGNCDYSFSYEDCSVRNAGLYNTFETHGTKVFLTHGHYYTDPQSAGLENSAFDIVVIGHTHIPRLEKRNNLVFLNPGSASRPRGRSRQSYARIFLERRIIEIYNLEDDLVTQSLSY